MDGLRTRGGADGDAAGNARAFQEVGTAFAVAPGGWLVSAAHVADPDAERIAEPGLPEPGARRRSGR